MNNKLADIETKVFSQNVKIDAMNHRLVKCEHQAASDHYHLELEKQRLLKNNVSIFAVSRKEGENLVQIIVSTIFDKFR